MLKDLSKVYGEIDFVKLTRTEVHEYLAEFSKNVKLNLEEHKDVLFLGDRRTNEELLASLEQMATKKSKKRAKRQVRKENRREMEEKMNEEDKMVESFKRTLERQNKCNCKEKIKPAFSSAWINKLNTMF